MFTKVHIIHVGNMANKGTQALLKSDIYLFKEIKNDVEFSVSTTDIEGVKRLNLPLKSVLPPLIDIPYEKADTHAKKVGYDRRTLNYKLYVLFSLIYMCLQAFLSLISAILCMAGIKPIYRAEVINRIKECDLIISCSGENFKEGSSSLPLNVYWVITWWSMLFARTWEITIARKIFVKHIIIFPNSMGPFRTRIGRFLARLALDNTDCILIREPISYKIAKSLGIGAHMMLTSDTALVFRAESNMRLSNFRNPMIGVSLGVYSHSLSKKKFYDYVLEYARALDDIIHKYDVEIIFMPHYVSGFRDDDLGISELISNKLRYRDRTRIFNVATVDEYKSLLDRLDILVSSKMHPAVLASTGFVPTLYIVYDHKQTGFFQQLSMLDCSIDIQEISCRKILSKIDFIWKNRQNIRNTLKGKIPSLQENIKKTVRQSIDLSIGCDRKK